MRNERHEAYCRCCIFRCFSCRRRHVFGSILRKSPLFKGAKEKS
nr:MAG TPA: hypothetical protein [Caudoviricetes sp.]